MHTFHLLLNKFHAHVVCANVQIIKESWKKKKKTQKYEYVLVGSTVKSTYYIIIIILENQKRTVNPDSKYIYIFQKTIQAVFLP